MMLNRCTLCHQIVVGLGFWLLGSRDSMRAYLCTFVHLHVIGEYLYRIMGTEKMSKHC